MFPEDYSELSKRLENIETKNKNKNNNNQHQGKKTKHYQITLYLNITQMY